MISAKIKNFGITPANQFETDSTDWLGCVYTRKDAQISDTIEYIRECHPYADLSTAWDVAQKAWETVMETVASLENEKAFYLNEKELADTGLTDEMEATCSNVEEQEAVKESTLTEIALFKEKDARLKEFFADATVDYRNFNTIEDLFSSLSTLAVSYGQKESGSIWTDLYDYGLALGYLYNKAYAV